VGMRKTGRPLVEFLRSVDTPPLSNAIELLQVRPKNEGFAPLRLRSLFPEFGRLCGHAVTAHVETFTRSGDCEEAKFLELFRAVASAPKPAVVALQEVGGCGDCAVHCGELMATIFNRLGAVGLVSDCAVRDIAQVRALKFHYFARGSVASYANFRVVRVGIPIQVLGLIIQPGALLHGDENGLIVVPPEVFSGLRRAVERIRSRERKLIKFVRTSNFSVNSLRGRFLE